MILILEMVPVVVVMDHVRLIVEVHVSRMLYGNLLLVQGHHVKVPVLTVVKHHAILQALSLVLLMAVQIVQPNVTMVVHHVRDPVQEVAVVVVVLLHV